MLRGEKGNEKHAVHAAHACMHACTAHTDVQYMVFIR